MTDDDIERLKARMLRQFDIACSTAENRDSGDADNRALNRQAAGTLGLAILAAERELRERRETDKTFTLIGKEKRNGP